MNLQELISRDYELKGGGKYLRAIKHDSLVIDKERQLFFWNSKNINGDAFDWLTKIKGWSIESAREFVSKNFSTYTFPIPEREVKDSSIVVYDRLVDEFFERGKSKRDYWRNVRGYTDSTIDLFKLGYSNFCYVIPIFVNRKFVNFQCRTHEPRRMWHWYKNTGPHPFNLDYIKNQSWGVLTEGPVDAIMLMQNGIPAFSHTAGAGAGHHVMLDFYYNLLPLEKIYIAYDNDKAGRKGSYELGKVFGDRAWIYNMWDFEEKADVSDYFIDGGTARGFMELLEKQSKHWFEVGKWESLKIS